MEPQYNNADPLSPPGGRHQELQQRELLHQELQHEELRQQNGRQQGLTEEQIAIIRSTGNIRINAVAGSGKTTTVIEYAASRPADARILYLAFNKSVKLEATGKFEARGLRNVKVETAHSLAYKHIVYPYGYNVKANSYKTYEIVDLLGLAGTGEKHAEYILANHISRFLTYFCNSEKPKVQDLDYLDTIHDDAARGFVGKFYPIIENGVRQILARMDKGTIDITHDFYLKKFQLSDPILPYDYILFDEGQDASGVMLDVFLKQKATKVIVGDVHQQIYGWRHAVNSLEKTDFKTFHLSASFRFPQDIARLASDILTWKKNLHEFTPVTITGRGTDNKEVSKATIARTNLGLLLKAIEYVTDHRKGQRIYFEGNISSYTYADDGASLYDVLNLYNNQRDRIRDKLILSMKDMDELEEYIEKTEDVQLSMMAEIVKEYGDEIYGIIKSLKDLHITGDDKSRANMVFSTVHRAKGMEYDVVYLVDDFITEERLEKLKAREKEMGQPLHIAKWNEEINLLYVAVTRARYKLYIPGTLLPRGFPASKNIIPEKNIAASKNAGTGRNITSGKSVTTGKNASTSNSILPGKNATSGKSVNTGKRSVISGYNGKAARLSRLQASRQRAEKKQSHTDAYQPWTADLDKELTAMADTGAPIATMAEYFGRTKGAVYSRLKKLGYFS
ncbi:MAG TPA: 3'-5' exonuclease [Puia sp.]|nr:3'-5' exonuclease [Puia sp.]